MVRLESRPWTLLGLTPSFRRRGVEMATPQFTATGGRKRAGDEAVVVALDDVDGRTLAVGNTGTAGPESCHSRGGAAHACQRRARAAGLAGCDESGRGGAAAAAASADREIGGVFYGRWRGVRLRPTERRLSLRMPAGRGPKKENNVLRFRAAGGRALGRPWRNTQAGRARVLRRFMLPRRGGWLCAWMRRDSDARGGRRRALRD